MRIRTLVVLGAAVFNSAWLCWVFVNLYQHGQVLVHEFNRSIAAVEIILSAGLILLTLERLLRLEERR